MNLARFARRRYTPGATPIEPMPHLTKALGGPELFIKRDDLMEIGLGGNKLRSLEFWLGAALRERADIVLLLVDHDSFKTFDREKLQEKIVIDTKGLLR